MTMKKQTAREQLTPYGREGKTAFQNTRVGLFSEKRQDLPVKEPMQDPLEEAVRSAVGDASVIASAVSAMPLEEIRYLLLLESGEEAALFGLSPAPYYSLAVCDRYGCVTLSDIAREETAARAWLLAFSEGAVTSFCAAEVAEELLAQGRCPLPHGECS